MMACAVLFGLLAVFGAQTWLNYQADLRLKSLEAPAQPAIATKTVVVAGAPLRYGRELTSGNLREVAWPEGAIPGGTFGSIADLLAPGKRIALSSIEPNEPILATKITGPGQKATLSALIQEGQKAVTIRVNDVDGVAGFVLPGDHVDILVTRQVDKGGNTDVVLQNVRVLAIDQLADDATDKPMVAKAVTLEVDTVAAQRLSLAGSIGALSLALRKAGELAMEGTRRITLLDLDSPYTSAVVQQSQGSTLATVTVTRGGKPQDYSVPAEGKWREATGAAQQDSKP
jgi:pilus assembly protein CpaB